MSHLTTYLPLLSCPLCAHKIDGATSFPERTKTPKPGDYSVCAYCAGVLRFDYSLTSPSSLVCRGATQKEALAVCRESPKFALLVKRMSNLRKQRNRRWQG